MTPKPAPVGTRQRALVAVLLVLATGLLSILFNVAFADDLLAVAAG